MVGLGNDEEKDAEEDERSGTSGGHKIGFMHVCCYEPLKDLCGWKERRVLTTVEKDFCSYFKFFHHFLLPVLFA